MATYIVLPLIIVFLRMTYGLLQEKEKKIKEGMKIMGMNDSSFYLCWMIYYELIYLIISLIVSAVMKGSVATKVIITYIINLKSQVMDFYFSATNFFAGV